MARSSIGVVPSVHRFRVVYSVKRNPKSSEIMVKLSDYHLILYEDHAGHFSMNNCNQLYKIWNTGTGIKFTSSFVIVPVNRTIWITIWTRHVKGIVIGASNEPITCEAGLVVSIWATSAISYTNYQKI